MPIYPICIRCLGTDSELDVEGVCSTCHTRGAFSNSHKDRSTNALLTMTASEEAPPSNFITGNTFQNETVVHLQCSHPPAAKLSSIAFRNYKNLEFIDRGGMGIVYKALQIKTGRIVALKTLNGIGHTDSQLAKRFKTEGRVLASLSHPGIVQIYEVDEDNGLPFISMEYVAGGTLAQILRTRPRPTPAESASLIADIASALAAAHAKKIIHRDVKPGNILISESGKPKLTDFGLAVCHEQAERMTCTGAILGTPAYMAPEQAEKQFGTISPLSDIYSLGATLYEMLTGRPPFLGETPVVTAVKVCSEAVVPPRVINPSIPLDLERICLKCLEKRPADRYACAAILANDLTRFLRGEPIGKASTKYRVRQFAKRNGKSMALLLLVAFAYLSIGMYLTRKVTPVEPNRVARSDSELARAEMEQAFRERKRFSIMGKKGLPRYFKYECNPAVLTEGNDSSNSDHGDHVAWFQTNKMTLLELCPDNLGISFRFEVTIQHVNEQDPSGRIGLYFKSLEGDQIQRAILADFSEYPSFTPGRNANAKSSNFLKITDQAFFFTPECNTPAGLTNAKSFSQRFPFLSDREKPWRKLVLTVTPEEYVAELFDLDSSGQVVTEPGAKTSRFAHYKTTEGDKHWQNLARNNPKIGKDQIVPHAPIHGSIGIFAAYSEVAFRDVTITPLP